MEATKINLAQSIKQENYLKSYVADRVIPQRFINFGRNTKLSKCIGLIGPRGSCKSIGAAAMGIIDYLIPGSKLISNIEVKWGLRLGDFLVGYASEELDKMEMMKFNIEENVAVLIDEVNIEFSEARRSMTNRNLIFNKILQQLRKRSLNVIYTVQHEMWIDNRLRYQTNVFIKTQDVCMMPGGIHLPYDLGEYASWKVFDMSGIFGQGSYVDTHVPVIDGWNFSAKQWWNTFDTKQVQGIEQAAYGGDGEHPLWLKRSGEIEREENNNAQLSDLILDLHNKGITEVPSEKMYASFGITAIQDKKNLGAQLKKLGIQYIAWKKAYRISNVDLENPETMRVPKEALATAN